MKAGTSPDPVERGRHRPRPESPETPTSTPSAARRPRSSNGQLSSASSRTSRRLPTRPGSAASRGPGLPSTVRSPGCSSTSGSSSWPRTEPIPLLERARFLAIFASQPRRVLHGPGGRPQATHRDRARPCAAASGLDPREVLEAICERARPDGPPRARLRRPGPARHWRPRASPSCAGTSSATEEQTAATSCSADQIFPVLTPLAVDPAHPFPYISGLSLNLAVLVRQPRAPGKEHFARVKVPPLLPRFIAGRGRLGRRASPDRDRHGRRRSSRSRTSSPRTSDQLFPGMEVQRAPHLPGHPQRGRRGRGGRRREPPARPWRRSSLARAGSARRCASRSPDDMHDHVHGPARARARRRSR